MPFQLRWVPAPDEKFWVVVLASGEDKEGNVYTPDVYGPFKTKDAADDWINRHPRLLMDGAVAFTKEMTNVPDAR